MNKDTIKLLKQYGILIINLVQYENIYTIGNYKKELAKIDKAISELEAWDNGCKVDCNFQDRCKLKCTRSIKLITDGYKDYYWPKSEGM